MRSFKAATLNIWSRFGPWEERLVAIRPELEALQRRHADDPIAYLRESRALQEKHGIRPLTPGTLVGGAVQALLTGGVLSAVRGGFASKARFLWIADLARRDIALVLGATALTAWLTARAPTAAGQTTPTTFVIVAILGTAIFLWTTSSAAALSFGAGSLVSVLQNWLLARDAKRPTVT